MMGALIRALTNNAVENIEEALGMTDATSSAMKHAIAEWYAAWYGRAPTKTEDPCQRLPYAIVNKLCKASESYAANTAAAIDATPKAQAAEYYRILCLHADVYRGCS